MSDIALKAVQLRGKLRRFAQAKFQDQDNDALLAKRNGDCNRCGACCKILFRCPFLRTEEEGKYSCLIYDQRFAQCRLFPLHAEDLLEVAECSYTFQRGPEPDYAAAARAPMTEEPSTSSPE